MKWLVIVVLLVPVVLASTGETILERGDILERDGKTIIFTGTSSQRANFDVDGVIGAVRLQEWDFINGVNLYYDSKSAANNFRDVSVVINYSISFTCGNGICEKNESAEVCCTDCGCGSGQCYANRCILDIECTVDENCTIDDPCALSFCSGLPPSCQSTFISTCSSNDGCCPTACSEDEDLDCFTPECRSDDECDDNDDSTEDSCHPPGDCVFVDVLETNVAVDAAETINKETVDVAPKEEIDELVTVSKRPAIRWDIAIVIVIIFFIGFIVAMKLRE